MLKDGANCPGGHVGQVNPGEGLTQTNAVRRMQASVSAEKRTRQYLLGTHS